MRKISRFLTEIMSETKTMGKDMKKDISKELEAVSSTPVWIGFGVAMLIALALAKTMGVLLEEPQIGSGEYYLGALTVLAMVGAAFACLKIPAAKYQKKLDKIYFGND